MSIYHKPETRNYYAEGGIIETPIPEIGEETIIPAFKAAAIAAEAAAKATCGLTVEARKFTKLMRERATPKNRAARLAMYAKKKRIRKKYIDLLIKTTKYTSTAKR